MAPRIESGRDLPGGAVGKRRRRRVAGVSATNRDQNSYTTSGDTTAQDRASQRIVAAEAGVRSGLSQFMNGRFFPILGMVSPANRQLAVRAGA